MTRDMMWIGLLATVLIVVVLGTVALREPSRQVEAAARLQAEAVGEGMDLYAQNCVICHGAAGEGLGAYPALNSEGLRDMALEDIIRTIERGRYGTAMAAYSVDEGGILIDAQVRALATLVQAGDWAQVAARVDELGLTPPPITVVVLSDDLLAQVRALPEGDTLADGLTLFAENCAACHGGSGEGSALAPALNSPELRARLTDADLNRIITQGVPGTLMAAWNAALTDAEVADLVALVRGWDALDAAGIALPVVAPPAVELSPEAIAEGQWLFGLLCAQCHGTNGYGSPMAPALNNALFLSQTPDAAIQQIIALGVQGTSMPAWGGRLTEADITALTAYIRNWEATAPPIVQ
ncbi:MAG: hypothetical protein Kow0077_11130 [Anaerolineae bacterium]